MPEQDIVAEALERSFGGEVVVDRVDLSIDRGQLFACLGPPGAGRTPLIRMLCGLLSPSGGKAKVAGYDVSSHPVEVRRRVGVVLSGDALDPHEPGRDALRFQGRLRGLTGAFLNQRVDAALEMAGLSGLTGDRIGALDLPTARRLELAAALLHGPRVLFLDEVTVGLDKPDAAALLSTVRDTQRALGTTVLMATQATAEADQIADRVGIMMHGRVVVEGDIGELKASVGGEIIAVHVNGPAEQAGALARSLDGVSDVVINGQDVAVLASGAASLLSPLAAVLKTGGVEAASISLRKATLDDVFLELTGKHLELMGGRATMAFPARS